MIMIDELILNYIFIFAKQNKFKIILIYLYLQNNIENILRVKNRVLAGGHNVPEKDIIRRY